jgi:hypothetical protein
MDYRVVWIHGIGPNNPHYSDAWTQIFNEYLNLPVSDFIEVYWRDVFTAIVNILNQRMIAGVPSRTVQKEIEVHNMLATVLLARETAQRSDLLGEWSDLMSRAGTNEALLPDWVTNPDAFLGEFVKYLVNRDIRIAVKEKAKAQLRPLASLGYDISIIAHSWGTVVAYESLVDLQRELPVFQLTNLFTLGSPLWLVQYLLDDPSGRKPLNVANWVNIHAQGDLIGSWLNPGFQVDQDYAVRDFSNGADAHDSYFLDGNVAVQRDIVAATILS